jgi:hypothetical protein
MPTAAETQQNIDSLTAKNKAIYPDVVAKKNDAADAYEALEFAKSGPSRGGGGTFFLNGQKFNNKADYISALQQDYNVKQEAFVTVAKEYNGNLNEIKTLQAELEASPQAQTSPVLNSNAAVTQTASDPDPAPPSTEQAEAVVAAQAQTDTAATTNPSQSELDSKAKIETADIVDTSNQVVDERAENRAKNVQPYVDESTSRAAAAGLSAGAEKAAPPPTSITVVTRQGSKMGKDLRVKLRVPPKYLEPDSMTAPLISFGGIIFPYTPTISYEAKADYGASNPMHSNFPINFYQRSSTSLITISGKFSVQNTKDAKIYLATIHLLRALIRMRSGGANNGDKDSGAPPPVCRLDGYGAMMLENVPVAVTSYRAEFPDSVDYFTIATPWVGNDIEKTSVPTLSTIAITCLPMYSREEMQKFSVTGYLNGAFKGKGFI